MRSAIQISEDGWDFGVAHALSRLNTTVAGLSRHFNMKLEILIQHDLKRDLVAVLVDGGPRKFGASSQLFYAALNKTSDHIEVFIQRDKLRQEKKSASRKKNR